MINAHAYSCLAYAYSEAHNISYEEAIDKINQAISSCSSITLPSTNNFSSVEEAILDILDLGSSWSNLFN